MRQSPGRQTVIAIHDYQHGGVGMIIECEDIDALQKALGRSWEILSEQIEEHPLYHYALARQGGPYDFSRPDGVLADILFISARQSEGKTGFPVRVRQSDQYLYRNVWAHSKADVTQMLPGCEFLYGMMVGEPLVDVDIDAPDKLLSKYIENHTPGTGAV